MSAAENKAIARRIGEGLFNAGNLRVVDELVAPRAIDHNEPPGTDCREHFKRVATMLRSAFPDLQCTTEALIAEGDDVVARITMTGTHGGPGSFFGLPPSGRRFEIQQMRLLRIVGGQMTESWAVIDLLAWMQQLGGGPQRSVSTPSTTEATIRGL